MKITKKQLTIGLIILILNVSIYMLIQYNQKTLYKNNNTQDAKLGEVKILADIDTYIPTMRSTPGIGLTPPIYTRKKPGNSQNPLQDKLRTLHRLETWRKTQPTPQRGDKPRRKNILDIPPRRHNNPLL